MTKLGPGMYDDGAGVLHIDLGEMLAHYGYADTPVNRAAMIAAAADLVEESSGKPLDLTITDEPLNNFQEMSAS